MRRVAFRYIVLTPLLAAALTFALAACSANSGPKVLGLVSITVNDPNNQAVITGATAEAKAKGWDISVVDANGNADQANSAIQNFVQRKTVAIMDLVFPTTSLRAGLLAAQKAKIPVATWGGGLGEGVVITDGDGGPFAQPIVDKMLKDMGNKGSILALTYHTARSAASVRTSSTRRWQATPPSRSRRKKCTSPVTSRTARSTPPRGWPLTAKEAARWPSGVAGTIPPWAPSPL